MESELLFGKVIWAARKAAGLTQQQLAKEAGISKAYVGTIENARPHTITGAVSRPERDVAIKIINVLNSHITEEDFKIDVKDALSFLGYTPPIENKAFVLGEVKQSMKKVLPSELAIMDFDGFDEEDLQDIAEYVAFKRAQKEKQANK